MQSLCELGSCPYYNTAYNDPSGHGCTRFSTAAQCPAVAEFSLNPQRSEYALYGDVSPATFRDFMERWLSSDRKYHSDLDFQQEFPGELPFPSRAIDHPCTKFTSN